MLSNINRHNQANQKLLKQNLRLYSNLNILRSSSKSSFFKQHLIKCCLLSIINRYSPIDLKANLKKHDVFFQPENFGVVFQNIIFFPNSFYLKTLFSNINRYRSSSNLKILGRLPTLIFWGHLQKIYLFKTASIQKRCL